MKNRLVKNFVYKSTLVANNIHIGDIYNVNGEPRKILLDLTTLPYIDPKAVYGRKDELDALRNFVRHSNKVVLIQGSAGVGKTTLAKYFLANERANYKHVCWIEITSDVRSAFLKNIELIDSLLLSDEFNTLPRDKNFVDAAFRLIINRMRELEGAPGGLPNLLILENAGPEIEHTQLLDRLALRPHWRVLATSRHRLEGLAIQELSTLRPTDAVAMFYHHYHHESNDDLVHALLGQLDYVPLLIELVAKTAQRWRHTLTEITENLKKKGLNTIRAASVKLPHNYNLEVSDVFEYISALFDLADLNPLEEWLSIQFAVLPAVQIPYRGHNNESLLDFLGMPSGEERDRITASLNSIVDKGWLQWDQRNDAFRMHQVLQEVLRYRLSPSANQCARLIENLQQFLHVEPNANPLATARFIEYGESICRNIAIPNVELTTLGNAVVLRLTDIGAFRRALVLMQTVFDYRKQLLDPTDKLLANSHVQLAMLIDRVDGDFDLAMAMLHQAIAILETYHPDELEFLGDAYNSLSLRLWHSGNLEDAAHYIEKTINIDRRKYNTSEHPYIALGYNSMGRLYLDMGKFDIALDWQKKAVSMLEALVDPHHPHLAAAYDNLGLILTQLGRFEEAWEFQQQALDIKKIIYAEYPQHFELANSYNQLALILRRQNYFEKALEYQTKAHSIYNAEMGSEHRDLAISHYNLAEIYFGLGNIALATEHLATMQHIVYKRFPNGHQLFYSKIEELGNRIKELDS